MTLDRLSICILSVPIAGIATAGAASARQFVFRNGELVGLASLNQNFTPVALDDGARNSAPEVAMTEPVENQVSKINLRGINRHAA